MKFSNKLSFVILLTGIIVLILLSFTLYKYNYNVLIKSQFMYTKSIADKVAGNFEQLLHEKMKTALTLANTPVIIEGLKTSNLFYANMSVEKRKESIKFLDEKWKLIKDPTDNFILQFTDNAVSQLLKEQQSLLKDEYGEIFLTNKFGALIASTSKLSTFAHGHKYWWLGSYNHGEGAVFFDDRGYDDSVDGYVLGLVVPVRKGTEIIGILKCNLNIFGSVSKVISSSKDNLIGKFKLTRSNGLVVFEEGFEPLSTQVHDYIFKNLTSKNNESFIINDSGEKYLIGFSEIQLTKGGKEYGFGGTFESIDHKKGNTGESWYVICYRQMSVVLSPITESIKSTFFISTAIIFILVLVSQLFGRKIAKPLTILDNATVKIGKGDFKHRIDMKRNDEFGNLVNSFNKMASKLQQTTTSVELLGNEVTHRKQTEKDLRKSEDKYRSLVEATSDWIWEVDQNNIYSYASPKTRYIFGIEPQEVIGKTPYDFMPADEAERVGGLYRDIVDSRKPFGGLENTILHKNGQRVVLETNGVPIFDEDGNLTGYRGMTRDITKRKQTEEEKLVLERQIQQAEKAMSLSRMAGSVAHHFNNMLAATIGNLELAIEKMPPEIGILNHLVDAQKAAMRAAEMSGLMLTFLGQSKKKPKPYDLSENCRQHLVQLRTDMPEGIHLETDLPVPGPVIKADLSQLRQVLSALFINAVEAMNGSSSRVHVSVGTVKATEIGEGYRVPAEWMPSADAYACLIVTDNGRGMDAKTIGRIFDPFYTDKFTGRGLGLAVAIGIVKAHDGGITVVSEPGHGSTFKVFLPLSDEDIPRYKETAVQTLPEIKRGGAVLLVEDHDMVRDITKAILEQIGFEVLIARDGVEAVEIFRENQDDIGLVLSDMSMPRMNGWETLAALRAIRTDIPVILSSGYDEAYVMTDNHSEQPQAFLHKPYQKKTLEKTIELVLKENRVQANKERMSH